MDMNNGEAEPDVVKDKEVEEVEEKKVVKQCGRRFGRGQCKEEVVELGEEFCEKHVKRGEKKMMNEEEGEPEGIGGVDGCEGIGAEETGMEEDGVVVEKKGEEGEDGIGGEESVVEKDRVLVEKVYKKRKREKTEVVNLAAVEEGGENGGGDGVVGGRPLRARKARPCYALTDYLSDDEEEEGGGRGSKRKGRGKSLRKKKVEPEQNGEENGEVGGGGGEGGEDFERGGKRVMKRKVKEASGVETGEDQGGEEGKEGEGSKRKKTIGKSKEDPGASNGDKPLKRRWDSQVIA